MCTGNVRALPEDIQKNSPLTVFNNIIRNIRVVYARFSFSVNRFKHASVISYNLNRDVFTI